MMLRCDRIESLSHTEALRACQWRARNPWCYQVLEHIMCSPCVKSLCNQEKVEHIPLLLDCPGRYLKYVVLINPLSNERVYELSEHIGNF